MHDALSSSSLTGATILLETERSAVTYDYVCIIVLSFSNNSWSCSVRYSVFLHDPKSTHVTLAQTLQALIA